MSFVIQTGKTQLGGDKVHRVWLPNPDGSLRWRKRSNIIFDIEKHNVGTGRKWPVSTQEGFRFYMNAHSITLDDFVLLWDTWTYCHIGTGYTFSSRQLRQIFKDRSTWPVRLQTGDRWTPSRFIRKYNRVDSAAAFKFIRGMAA